MSAAAKVHVPTKSRSSPSQPRKNRKGRRRLYTKAAKRGRRCREKGAEGERELVALGKEYGFSSATRTAPMQAGERRDDKGRKKFPDVANLGRLWAERKRHRRVNVQAEMRDLLAVERPGFVRVLFHRDNGGPELATLEAEELLKLEAAALGIGTGGGSWQAVEDAESERRPFYEEIGKKSAR